MIRINVIAISPRDPFLRAGDTEIRTERRYRLGSAQSPARQVAKHPPDEDVARDLGPEQRSRGVC